MAVNSMNMSLPMQSRLNTFVASSSGTFGAAGPCLASGDNADDDASDAMWQSMFDDIDINDIAGIAGCGNTFLQQIRF